MRDLEGGCSNEPTPILSLQLARSFLFSGVVAYHFPIKNPSNSAMFYGEHKTLLSHHTCSNTYPEAFLSLAGTSVIIQCDLELQ